MPYTLLITYSIHFNIPLISYLYIAAKLILNDILSVCLFLHLFLILPLICKEMRLVEWLVVILFAFSLHVDKIVLVLVLGLFQ